MYPSIKVYSMTGIRIVNNTVLSLYETFILCGIAGFAAYDLEKRRVPDRLLAVFCLVALPAPFCACLALYGMAHLAFIYPFFCNGCCYRIFNPFVCFPVFRRYQRNRRRRHKAGGNHGIHLWSYTNDYPTSCRLCSLRSCCVPVLPETSERTCFPSICSISCNGKPSHYHEYFYQIGE